MPILRKGIFATVEPPFSALVPVSRPAPLIVGRDGRRRPMPLSTVGMRLRTWRRRTPGESASEARRRLRKTVLESEHEEHEGLAVRPIAA